MFKHFALVALLGVGLVGAFQRTASDVSPFATNYTQTGPTLNLTGSQLTPGEPINSYWTIYFLSASNNHSYFAVGHVQFDDFSPLEPSTIYRVSLLDITSGTYYGTANTTSGISKEPSTDFNVDLGLFKTYSPSNDLLSTMVSTSSVPGASFNLTSVPKGPNLYDAGAGFFFWGINTTTEWGAPECWVTGTVEINGTEVDVIPEQSMSWYDRQYGPGFGTAGWNLFILLLENGVKICVWDSKSVDHAPKQLFATIMFSDGHHEIYPVDEDIHSTNPFVSELTNITYYGDYRVDIPLKNISLNITLPVLAGEMVNENDPTTAEALFEGYATAQGTFDGSPIKGWGVSEKKAKWTTS
ncbi:MAG: hypothetical protein M1834_008903 [Cirrosporium novae-zelandiae]|nr:MAG: hypothetical protein M1834_008903 [Cirrosporium novae-zelandiae]